MKILLAEDEPELSAALTAILRHDRYSVDAVYNGEDAYSYGRSGEYDAVILDIMMPRMNGIEVLRALRAEGITTPVLLLTARSDLRDKIEGLDSGADDYLTKPFEMGELLARIRALTRRRNGIAPDELRFGSVTLDRRSYCLSAGGGSVRLGNKEFQMMELLMSDPGVLISAEKFMDRVWGYDSDAEINVVWVYISYLRKKLASIGADIEIRAARGVGYALSRAEIRDKM